MIMLNAALLTAALVAGNRENCNNYVAATPTKTNKDCASSCEEVNGCIYQPPEASGCYGNYMYGYSEEYELGDEWTAENAWDNDFHYTVIMAAGSTPADCQQMCQEHEECGFFGFRADGVYDDAKSPTCLMKKRSTVVLANDRPLPLEDWTCNVGQACYPDYSFCNLGLAYNCNTPGMYDCKTCEGSPVCAWRSDVHISGPRVCDGEDSWMVENETCGNDTTEAILCDHPTWRNPLTPNEGNYAAHNRLCEDQNFRTCAELSNYLEVQWMCPKTCSEFLGGVENLGGDVAYGEWCDVEVPAKRTDCCDSLDFRYHNTPCTGQYYNCNLPEVQEHCPATCQKDPLPWNEISDVYCHAFCSN